MSISFSETAAVRVFPNPRFSRSSELHVDLVDVAPAPAFPRLERGDDRMPGLLEMLGGVLVLRVVAASDVPARPAQAKMHPGVSRGEAFLAAVGVGRVRFYKLQMSASGRHRDPLHSSMKMHGESYHQEASRLARETSRALSPQRPPPESDA